MNALQYLQERCAEYGGRATLVGKGPSCTELDDAGRHAGRLVVGLNETALRRRCDVSFVIDNDILMAAGDRLAACGIDRLITPRVMHEPVKRIGNLTLYGPSAIPAAAQPWQAGMDGRWLAFNLATTAADDSLGPAVTAANFSAPVAAELLARAGFRDILLAGIDGGTRYADTFGDVEHKKLKSVQSNFDAQFRELRDVRDRHGVVFRSVRCADPSVMVGSEPEQALCAEVMRWSLESNTFLTLRYLRGESTSRDLYAQGSAGTPFSLQRIAVPELAGRSGRSVYFDSDMLVFRDVYELFNRDMDDAVLLGCAPTPGRPPQFSVFLVDNERADWDASFLLDELRVGRITYEQLIGDFAFVPSRRAALPQDWNSLEYFVPGETANLHFTDMGTQPWLSIYNPNAELWCEALFKAVDSRASVVQALEESLRQGWVRPSLGWQVEHRRSDPWSLPRHVKSMDARWLPPHNRLRYPGSVPRWQQLRWRLASRVRRLMQSKSYVRMLKARQALSKVL